MMKKTSVRTCIITRQKCSKQELLRIVIKDNKMLYDLNQNLPGRGYYLINNVELLKSEKTKQILIRRFKVININEFISTLE